MEHVGVSKNNSRLQQVFHDLRNEVVSICTVFLHFLTFLNSIPFSMM